MDESRLALGAALHVELALRSIAELAARPASKLGCSRVTGSTTSDDDGAAGDVATDARCREGTALEAED
eukprot:6602415-Prymnesium_polylepis.1